MSDRLLVIYGCCVVVCSIHSQGEIIIIIIINMVMKLFYNYMMCIMHYVGIGLV